MWYTISVIGRRGVRVPMERRTIFMRNDIYSLVNEFNNMFYDGGYKGFPLDVIEEDNGFKVIAEIPGVKKEDIQIEFEDGVLAISATMPKFDKNTKYLIHERRNQKLRRTINFGEILLKLHMIMVY